ncbi:MAG TPA: aldehyde dehydrogenase family protein, partial [Planctomycetota bacterium]|nr:aldehyde dehydrogenase family protein [Planctomycetota bacterium]
TSDVVGECAQAGPEELERAVEAAVRGFEATRRFSSAARSELLRKTAEGLARRRDEVARTITAENAKTIKLSRIEVDRAVATFTAAAEEARRIGGEVLPLDLYRGGERRFGMTRRFPLGPILAISPFNFPLNLVAHKVAPALAAGNSVVLKPASATPLTALLLGEILQEAGAPAGALNVVPCAGADAERLVADDRFKLLSFTGSPAVGWSLKAKAGRKRVVLELGGNAAAVVHDDADAAAAAERCANGAFAYSGQICISVQRIYVQERIADVFSRELVRRAEALVLGDPFDEATDLGPMIDDAAAARTEAWVDEAVRGGARVLCGGRREGRFFRPTVLENVAPAMKVHCAEVFAPVVNLYRYGGFEEALAAVNDSAFGLQAGIFTRDLGRVVKAYETLEVGAVLINEAPTWRLDTMPYGGEKESGLGREGVRYAIEEMTQLRLMAVNPG